MPRAGLLKPASRFVGAHTFSSLQIRNYRLYFIGQGISLSGTWMQVIGQAWLVLKLSGSGTALGFVVALQFLPVLLLAPWGGVIADRFYKRRLLYLTQTCSGVLALTLAMLTATNVVRLWMVYVLAALLGLVNALDNPTRQTFVHEMAGRDRLRNAVTLNAIEVNLTRVLGPAMAGAIIATLGLAPCFFINAGSYVAVLVCLFLMDGKELYVAEPVERQKGQLREGFRYVLRTPILRDVLLLMAIIGTLTYEFSVSLPLLAKYTFNGSAGSYAWLSGAMGAGAVAGGLVAASRSRTRLRGLIWSAFGCGITIVLTSISPSLALACAGMVLVGAFSIGFTALSNTILQRESKPNMRGRVMSLWTVAFLGSTTLGGPLVGWIGGHANPRWALGVGGCAALLAGFVGLLAMRGYRSHAAAEERASLVPTSAEENPQTL